MAIESTKRKRKINWIFCSISSSFDLIHIHTSEWVISIFVYSFAVCIPTRIFNKTFSKLNFFSIFVFVFLFVSCFVRPPHFFILCCSARVFLYSKLNFKIDNKWQLLAGIIHSIGDHSKQIKCECKLRIKWTTKNLLQNIAIFRELNLFSFSIYFFLFFLSISTWYMGIAILWSKRKQKKIGFHFSE